MADKIQYFSINSKGQKTKLPAKSLKEAQQLLPKGSSLFTQYPPKYILLRESIRKVILSEKEKEEDEVGDLNIDLTGDQGASQSQAPDAGSSNLATPAMPDVGVVSNDKQIQKVYTKLVDSYNEARTLNDEKLLQQLANVITYFNKNIVLGDISGT